MRQERVEQGTSQLNFLKCQVPLHETCNNQAKINLNSM